jgi:16S rRNA (guanine966-N2)-methyltransferase
MRIIAGRLGGLEFNSPHGRRTRPMSDKVRGALFNVLGDLEGLTILDAFGGSGALSLEAISRGAEKVVVIERDGAAFSVIEKNIQDLKIGRQVHATRANAAGWSARNVEKMKYDILLLDPPYDELQSSLLQKLVRRHLKPGGLAVLSYPGNEEAIEFSTAEKIAIKKYGDIQLAFYRKIK